MKTKSHQLTKRWFEQTILGLNLCPFAHKPYKEGHVTFIEIHSENFEESILETHRALLRTIKAPYCQNLLISYPLWPVTFIDFNHFSEEFKSNGKNKILKQLYQVIVFHPKFRFQKLAPNNKANLVNRSPFPLLHFLPRSEMEKLQLPPKEGKKISQLNEQKIRSLSKKELATHFPWIYSKD